MQDVYVINSIKMRNILKKDQCRPGNKCLMLDLMYAFPFPGIVLDFIRVVVMKNMTVETTAVLRQEVVFSRVFFPLKAYRK